MELYFKICEQECTSTLLHYYEKVLVSILYKNVWGKLELKIEPVYMNAFFRQIFNLRLAYKSNILTSAIFLNKSAVHHHHRPLLFQRGRIVCSINIWKYIFLVKRDDWFSAVTLSVSLLLPHHLSVSPSNSNN